MVAFLFVFVRFGRLVKSSFADAEFQVLLTMAASMLGAGTLFYSAVEDWRWIDALYFSTVTLATVGYGDFSPQTDLGKLFTIVYIIFGLGILGGFINYLAKRTSQRAEATAARRREERAAAERSVVTDQP
jgi:hypothetical protein